MPESYSRRDLGYFADILINAHDALRFTRGMTKEQFIEDGVTSSAVMFCLVIAGEAVKNLSDDAKRSIPHIDWSEIAKFRDLAIHRYRHTDYDQVWNIVADDLPTLISVIEPIVPTPEEDA